MWQKDTDAIMNAFRDEEAVIGLLYKSQTYTVKGWKAPVEWVYPKEGGIPYISGTSIGIFEQTREGYGEIWFELGGRKTMSRMTTAEGVLEAIYSLAGVTPPAENDDAIFRGHPLAVAPKGAAAVFYAIWPAAIVVGAFFIRRRQT